MFVLMCFHDNPSNSCRDISVPTAKILWRRWPPDWLVPSLTTLQPCVGKIGYMHLLKHNSLHWSRCSLTIFDHTYTNTPGPSIDVTVVILWGPLYCNSGVQVQFVHACREFPLTGLCLWVTGQAYVAGLWGLGRGSQARSPNAQKGHLQ